MGIWFKALDKRLHSNILCLAEILVSLSVAFEIFETCEAAYDFLQFFLEVLFHTGYYFFNLLAI